MPRIVADHLSVHMYTAADSDLLRSFSGNFEIAGGILFWRLTTDDRQTIVGRWSSVCFK
jgi:hypothetical protein